MIVVALACVAAGSWQIYRFEQKRHENDALRRNAHAAVSSVQRILPLTGTGRSPSRYDVELRTVRVAGRYDPTLQTLVRKRSVDDVTGFFVVTPLRTDNGIVLVVRGFVPQPGSGAVPRPSAVPLGRVTVTARIEPPETTDDAAGRPRRPSGRVDQPHPTGARGSAARCTTVSPSCTPASRHHRPAGGTCAEPGQPGRRRARAAALRVHHPVVPVRAARARRAGRDGALGVQAEPDGRLRHRRVRCSTGPDAATRAGRRATGAGAPTRTSRDARTATRRETGRPLRPPRPPLTAAGLRTGYSALIAASQSSGSRPSPGPFISANRTTPSASTRNVPRLAKPVVSLNTP